MTSGRSLMAVLIVPHVLLIPLALTASPWAFAALAVACYAAEAHTLRLHPNGYGRLEKLYFGGGVRAVIRETAALMLVGLVALNDVAVPMLFAAGLICLHVLRAVILTLGGRVTTYRTLPGLCRNLDLSALRIPDAPPVLLRDRRPALIAGLGALPPAAAVAGTVSGTPALALTGPPVALAAGFVVAVLLHRHGRRNRHLGDVRRVTEVLAEQINATRAEVVVYACGNADNVYQVNMWLDALERLDRPVLILLRHRSMIEALDDTSLPVACLPKSEDVMNLALPDAKVALYVSNAGNNLHLLRRRGLRSVFIGHGDSDKDASFNPFSKVYDQIWVAGPAGRDRYLRAGIGVEDSAIVEVGRPQLAGIRPAQTRIGVRTVLYAPTWEGWVEGVQQCSLMDLGPAIVAAVLARPDLRLIYKPHPLTGTVDPRALAAHRAILRLVERANAARPPVDLAPPVRERPSGDEAQRCRDAGRADLSRIAGRRAAEAAWQAEYWAATRQRHVVVAGRLPGLYECFDQADLMIADISSVVADFLVSGKPYVVTNVAGEPAEEFRTTYPTASAAYLLGSADELGALIDRAFGPDDLAAARRELRDYLLGPDRFAAALGELLDPPVPSPRHVTPVP